MISKTLTTKISELEFKKIELIYFSLCEKPAVATFLF